MKQLDLFNFEVAKSKSVGRPNVISTKQALSIITEIRKSKFTNVEIMKKHNLKPRTFYRLKKGNYNHLLDEAISEAVDEFSLELTD